MIKTKIIATLGPASASAKTISSMIETGVNVFRINFSHGDFQDYDKLLKEITAAQDAAKPITAVMGDLCGPKIRTGTIQPDENILTEGDQVAIVPGEGKWTAKRFGTNYQYFVKDVQVGHRIFIDDGQISLLAVDKTDDEIICKVLVGGKLKTRKGINLPDTEISIDSITERDWQCVDWAMKNKIDFLALSFVRTSDEIKDLKAYINEKKSSIKVVSKIETPQAVSNLDSIIDASDAVLVARGDLGVEMDLAQVPLIQKRITKTCLDKGKPVIVATQMLQSMIDIPTPTRAEVSDVANAIMDMTDAVMLSGETAVGSYPLDAVKAITRIARFTEDYLDSLDEPRPTIETQDSLQLISTIARSVAMIIDQTAAPVAAIWSQGGKSAAFFSKARIDAPVLAFSSDISISRQMCVNYGIIPGCASVPDNKDKFASLVEANIDQTNLAQKGDKVVLVTEAPIEKSPGTNSITIYTIGAETV